MRNTVEKSLKAQHFFLKKLKRQELEKVPSNKPTEKATLATIRETGIQAMYEIIDIK